MFSRLLRPFKTFTTQSRQSTNISRKEIINDRLKYMSPSLKTFEAFDEPMVLDRGDKQYLYDIHGKKYIDLLGQNLCVSVGYNHPRLNKVVYDQMTKLQHATTMYYTEPSTKLAKEIVSTLPERSDGEDWVCHFVNSGSEAVDLAVQMACEYTGRKDVINFNLAYHGLQGIAAGLTAMEPAAQKCHSELYPYVKTINTNDLCELDMILREDNNPRPIDPACFIVEPVQGFGGVHKLNDNYLKVAFEMVKSKGGLTIADEVQSGICRTGETFWGFQNKHHGGVEPDIITAAKSMGNGYAIIGAVICKRSVAEAFSNKMWFNTYGSNPVACAASLEVFKIIKDDNVLENCNKQGLLINKELNKLCKTYPDVFKEVRGTGCFQGLEISGKTAEDSQNKAYELHKDLLNYGVIAGRGSATKNVLRIQPPMIIQTQDVLDVAEGLEQVACNYRTKRMGMKHI